jgi:hypothetical protein
MNRGAVTIPTMGVVTLSIFVATTVLGAVGWLNSNLSLHEQADAQVVSKQAADEATIAAIQSSINDIKATQQQELQILVNVNKKL